MIRHFKSPDDIADFLRERFDPVADYMGVRHWDRTLRFGSNSDHANQVAPEFRTIMTVTYSEPYQLIEVKADVEYMYMENFSRDSIVQFLEHEYIHALLSPFDTYHEDIKARYVPEGDQMQACNKLFVDRNERTVAQIQYMIGCLKRHLVPPEIATSSEIPNNS